MSEKLSWGSWLCRKKSVACANIFHKGKGILKNAPKKIRVVKKKITLSKSSPTKGEPLEMIIW